MEKVIASYIDTFPLKEAKKKEDIIFYDMPILTRYVFQNKDYLFYHVDDENEIDTFLVFEITEYDLFKLVSGNISLKNTILNVDNFVYLIDKNKKGELIKTAYLHSSNIIDEYLPEDDSILEIEFVKDSYFAELIEKHQADFYTEKLRERAFYIKIAPDRLNKKYGDTLGFEEMIDKILPNITSSYKKYTKIDFFNQFKDKITDAVKLNKAFNKISDLIDLRIVDLKFGSFEIGVASDTLMNNEIQKKDIKDWADNIGESFKEEVLEIDLNNPIELEKITSKFDDSQRAAIYSPIIKLANDKNIVFSVKENKYSKFKQVKKPKEATIKKLIPAKSLITFEDLDKELDLVQFTGVVERGKKINPNSSNGLFSALEESHQFLTTDIFKKYNINLTLEKDIPLTMLKKNKGIIEISAVYNDETFSVNLDNTNVDSAIEKLVNKVYEYYLNLNSD